MSGSMTEEGLQCLGGAVKTRRWDPEMLRVEFQLTEMWVWTPREALAFF